VTLRDGAGAEIGHGGAGLERVASIDLSGLDTRLADCAIEVMCDVDNPLLGPQGAAHVFGPQKGATTEMVPRLEAGLAAFAEALERATGMDVREISGGGAAGGVGAALAACLGARLRQGVRVVAELTHLEQAIRSADLVITGEGRLDGQTLRGKTPAGVAAIARRYRRPVIALAGAVGEDSDALREHGIAAVFPVAQGICSREQAFAQAAENLRRTARNVAALWDAATHAQSS
jgi:glycerate kinase